MNISTPEEKLQFSELHSMLTGNYFLTNAKKAKENLLKSLLEESRVNVDSKINRVDTSRNHRSDRSKSI
jgi:hypothetical protein